MKSRSNYLEGNENDKRLIRLLLELHTQLDCYGKEQGIYRQDEELNQLVLAMELVLLKLLDA